MPIPDIYYVSSRHSAARRFVMASREYCSSVGDELEYWSGRLHELSEKFDQVPSIDKYRVLPHIEELHILMTEIDDRLCNMMRSCSAVETFREERIQPTV
jgi:hypothetical protein